MQIIDPTISHIHSHPPSLELNIQTHIPYSLLQVLKLLHKLSSTSSSFPHAICVELSDVPKVNRGHGTWIQFVLYSHTTSTTAAADSFPCNPFSNRSPFANINYVNAIQSTAFTLIDSKRTIQQLMTTYTHQPQLTIIQSEFIPNTI